MIESAGIITFAYVLDLIFGDPKWMPHPVRGIGFMAEKLEPLLRMLIKNERLAGIVFSFLIIGTVYAVSFAVIRAAAHYDRFLGFLLSVLLVYAALAVKDLKVESMQVFWALANGEVERARQKLSLIVGRDTEGLSEKEMIRAAVETVAESVTDGILSPLFYAFLGGAPAALAYKAASTLDSMAGYKNEKYKKFGWASARIDDGFNFIPARLSAFLLPAAASILGLDGVSSFKIARRDGMKNPSPNSGIPEAAMAGALGVRLGGMNSYQSVPTVKPFLGDDKNALNLNHVKASIRVAYVSSLFALVLIWFAAFMFTYAGRL